MADLRHFLPQPETPVLVAGVFRRPDGTLECRLENGVSWDLTASEAGELTETVQRLYWDHLLPEPPRPPLPY